MFDYPHLETLWVVQNQGTFEKAAHKLNITRSAISQKMKWLEQRLGTPLISRNPVKTTKLGKRLCKHFEHVRLLETKLQLNHGHLFNSSGIDPINIDLMFHGRLIPTGLLEQLVIFSDYQSDFLINTTTVDEELIQLKMDNGDTGAAITSILRDNPLYIVHHLGKQNYMPVSSAAFAHKYFDGQIDISKLRRAPSVAHNSAPDLASRFLTQLDGNLYECTSDSFPSLYSIMNTCIDGKAWAMVPTPLAQNYLENCRLINLCPGETLTIDMYLYVLHSLEKIIPQLSEIIISAANDFLQPMDGPQSKAAV